MKLSKEEFEKLSLVEKWAYLMRRSEEIDAEVRGILRRMREKE